MGGIVPAGRLTVKERSAKRAAMRSDFEAEVRLLLAQADLDRSELFSRMRLESGSGAHSFLDRLFVRRNDVICLSLAIGLGVDRTQRLLLLSGNRALDVKVLRDAAIIFCIEKHFSVQKAQVFMRKFNLAAI